jgi:iron complex outermembrane receptor protein
VISVAFFVLALAQTPPPRQSPPAVSESVVVTATVAPIDGSRAGRTVATISREDLEQLGLRSVIDALRFVPGVDVRARGPRDVQTDFSIRGATFGQSLVLVDGLRLNDSQSGHHNGDVPAGWLGLDRIEVAAGAASAVYGADALAGAINFISRRDRHAAASIAAGQFGTVDVQASAAGHGLPANWMTTGWASRSGGFRADRDFAQGGAVVRGPAGHGVRVDLRHERNKFGADQFYGNSPSFEWTDQTVAAVSHARATTTWHSDVRAFIRHHADHFRWDIFRPGFAENRHTTNAVQVDAVVDRVVGSGAHLSAGATASGDRVRSSNLGDHRYAHAGAFGEWQSALGSRAALQIGARWDGYSGVSGRDGDGRGFGSAFSPSAAIAWSATSSLTLRASAAHAFRVPTFTELNYHDPANLGTPDLEPEHGWSIDTGAVWRRAGWSIDVSPFARWDENVIDWVRTSTADLWRSTNVRDVRTIGIDAGASRRWRGALVRASYTGIAVDAPQLDRLSKYVLEYARHSVGLAVATPLAAGVRAAIRLDYRNRLDGQSYVLAGLQVSRRVGRLDAFVDATNLFDETYHEVAGVPMPGRWIMAGFSLQSR